MSPPSNERTELLDLYKIAVDEYRFEVKLNWERMRYYVALGATLLGAGTGLLRLQRHGSFDLVLVLFFLVRALTSWIGERAIARGHEYYQETRRKKLVFENLLGLTGLTAARPLTAVPLAIATTQTMGRELHQDTLDAPTPLRAGTVVYYVALLLRLLMFTHLACGAFVFYRWTSDVVVPALVPHPAAPQQPLPPATTTSTNSPTPTAIPTATPANTPTQAPTHVRTRSRSPRMSHRARPSSTTVPRIRSRSNEIERIAI